jgi:sensor histidine kinase YesM
VDLVRDVVIWFSAFIDVLLIDAIFSSTMEKTSNKRLIAVNFFGLAAVIIALSYLMKEGTPRLMPGVAAAFFLSFLTYKALLTQRIVSSMLFFSIYMVGEYFAHGVISLINEKIVLGDNAFLVGVAASYTYLLTFRFFYAKVSYELRGETDAKSTLFLLGCSVFCAAIMVIILSFIEREYGVTVIPGYIFLSCSLFYLGFNLVMMQLLKRIYETHEVNKTRLMYESQLSNFTNVETINHLYSESRMVLHDLKHHLAAMYLMAGETEKPKMKDYMDDVIDRVPVEIRYDRTGNFALDTALLANVSIAEKAGIEVRIDASFAQVCMSDADVYVLVGNALENAIDACTKLQKEEHPVIEVTMRQADAYFHFVVRNPIEWEITERNGMPRTTKRDAQVHGYGMRSIASVVKNYDGMMAWSAKDGVFELRCFVLNPVEQAVG